jgi:hypothetical protein
MAWNCGSWRGCGEAHRSAEGSAQPSGGLDTDAGPRAHRRAPRFQRSLRNTRVRCRLPSTRRRPGTAAVYARSEAGSGALPPSPRSRGDPAYGWRIAGSRRGGRRPATTAFHTGPFHPPGCDDAATGWPQRLRATSAPPEPSASTRRVGADSSLFSRWLRRSRLPAWRSTSSPCLDGGETSTLASRRSPARRGNGRGCFQPMWDGFTRGPA